MVTRASELLGDEIEQMVDDESVDGRVVASGDTGTTKYQITGIEKNPEEATLYDLRTGYATTVRLYEGNQTLEKMLRKTDNDPASPWYGRRIFTQRSPQQNPEMFLAVTPAPQFPCWFSDEHPKVAEYRRMLGTVARCPGKGRFVSPESVRAHVENKHPRWFGQIRENEEESRRDEDRVERRDMLRAVLSLAGTAAARERTEVLDLAQEVLVGDPSTEAQRAVGAKPTWACELCDRAFDTEHGLKVHVGRDHKEG